MSFDRLLTNICSRDLARSRDFYVTLLGFAVGYDSDWYVQIHHPENAKLELGIIKRDSDLVPDNYRASPAGMYLTVVVPDVDAVHARAVELKVPVLQEPRNEFYGQRRALLVDPDGCLVDVCSPWGRGEN